MGCAFSGLLRSTRLRLSCRQSARTWKQRGARELALDAHLRLCRGPGEYSSATAQPAHFDRTLHGWICYPEISGETYYARSGAIVFAAAYRALAGSAQDCLAASAHLRQGQLDAQLIPAGCHSQIGARGVLLRRHAR